MIPSNKLRQPRGMFGRFGREFREFVARGNAVDLAVGVSLGTAFSRLMESFMQNIVTPPIRWLSDTIWQKLSGLQANVANVSGFDWTPPETGVGTFLSNLGSFWLLATSTFVVVKIVNRVKRTLEERALTRPADAPPDTAHEDTSTRLIAQNDRIIHLLEQLNAQASISSPPVESASISPHRRTWTRC